jgi:RimJ/RimL family protein N-acetyltransferase
MGEMGRPAEVALRDVVEEDIAVFFEHQQDPDAAAMAAFPSRSREDHEAHWRKLLADDTLVKKAIVVDGDVAGNIGSWIDEGHREVGYWIGKPFWGRGVATAALRMFLTTIEDRPLYAWVAHHNQGSIRVLERAGFQYGRDDADHRVYRLN